MHLLSGNAISLVNLTMPKLALIRAVFCVLTCIAAVHSSEDELSNLKKTVGKILKRLDDKDKQIEILRVKLAEQVTLNAELTLRVRQLEEVAIPLPKQKDHSQEESPVTVNKSESTAKEVNIRLSPQNRQRIRQAYSERPVAFFATLTSHLHHVGVNQIIAFDRVVTNVGNAYNPHFGAFVAPVSGIYVFSVSLLSVPGHTTHYSLFKNSVLISHIYLMTQPGTSQYESTSQTAVLQLHKGDDVTLRNDKGDESLYGGNYSTFAGFLLWEALEEPNILGK